MNDPWEYFHNLFLCPPKQYKAIPFIVELLLILNHIAHCSSHESAPSEKVYPLLSCME